MTFKNFEELFKSKYPEGTVFPHDVFEHGVARRIQKVAVVFSPNSKVYMYRGAYEDILCRCGINVISKERYMNLLDALKKAEERNGKEDEFFGVVVDCSNEIKRLSKELETYDKDFVIV